MDYDDTDDISDGYFQQTAIGKSPYAAPLTGEYFREPAPVRRRVLLPVMLFLATCVTTYMVGGVAFAVPLMFILTTHELGHFFQAVRYRVPASLPFFIPMPLSPIGTMGAVIGMQAHVGNRKALYDIGITGPLAGLVPAIACSVGCPRSCRSPGGETS